MKAVVLLSGGLDSTVTLAKAMKENTKVTALSFMYGQRHTKELESASNVCKHYKIDHVIMNMDLSMFRSALTRADIKVPENNKNIGNGIPETYVPARNIIMLSIAAGLCESLGAGRIYIGVNSVDYSGYPDCRPGFIEQFNKTLKVGTKAGVEGNPVTIETPIIDLSKKDIVLLGKELKAPLEMTWSCYNGREKACGKCDSCVLRLNGFREAGYKDGVDYEDV